MGFQRHALAALPPGKSRYPLYRRLGGHQGRSGRIRKISPLKGIRSPDRPARSESLYGLSYRGPHSVKGYLSNVRWNKQNMLRLRLVWATNIAVEKECVTYCVLVCVCVCSLSNPAYNAHASIFICGLRGNTVIFHIISYTHDFIKKKKYGTQNVRFDFLYNFCPKQFSI